MEGICTTEITKLNRLATHSVDVYGYGQVISNCAGGAGAGDLEGDQDGTDLMSQLMEEVR